MTALDLAGQEAGGVVAAGEAAVQLGDGARGRVPAHQRGQGRPALLGRGEAAVDVDAASGGDAGGVAAGQQRRPRHLLPAQPGAGHGPGKPSWSPCRQAPPGHPSLLQPSVCTPAVVVP